jgi:hypothetical protein
MVSTEEQDGAAIETWHSLERISHPLIRQFADYWQRKRGARRAPARCDIDPTELGSFLPHMFMLDVIRPDMRFKVRLVGTDMERDSNIYNSTGRFADEVVPPNAYAELQDEMEDVARHFVLRYKIADMAWQGRPYARYHRLMMPLSDDQSMVSIVLGIGYLIQAQDVPFTPLEAAIEIMPVSQSRILAAK